MCHAQKLSTWAFQQAGTEARGEDWHVAGALTLNHHNVSAFDAPHLLVRSEEAVPSRTLGELGECWPKPGPSLAQTVLQSIALTLRRHASPGGQALPKLKYSQQIGVDISYPQSYFAKSGSFLALLTHRHFVSVADVNRWYALPLTAILLSRSNLN